VPVLSKLLGFLVMPAGLLWLLLIGLTAWAGWRRRRRELLAHALVLVLYTLVGNVWLGSWLCTILEGEVEVVHPEDLEPLDALFVLGGGSKPGPRGWAEAGQAGDRVVLSARLHLMGKAPVLITSGRTVPGLVADMDITLDMAQLWMGLGVPESAIIRLSEPWNTSQEIPLYKALVEERGWRRVGILSSHYHLARVLAHCRRLGFDPIPIGADHRGGLMPFTPPFLVPQAEGFHLVQTAVWEWVGRLAGR
jgi:uncharacterized SAM-binding protein YcdF (DUF218 family)